MASSSTVKFRVKFLNDHSFSEFQLLTHLNSISALDVRNVYLTDTFATLHIEDPDALTPFRQPDNVKKLFDLHLVIEEDQSTKSLRTIFIPRTPHFVASAPKDYLTTLIQDANPPLIVEDLYFLGSATKQQAPKNNLKITFQSKDMVDTAMDRGLKLGHLQLSPDQISRDSFITVVQCYKCLQFGHATSTCSAPQVCSRCTGNHFYRLCSSKTFLCLHCNENHSAVNVACPARKLYAHNFRQSQAKPSTSAPSFQPAPLPEKNAWEATSANSNSVPSSNMASTSAFPTLQSHSNVQLLPHPPPNPANTTAATPLSTPPLQPASSTPPISSPSLPPAQPGMGSAPPPLTPSAPPSQPPPSSIPPPELTLQYNAFDSFAKLAAESNSLKYLRLMSEFFKQFNLPFVTMTDSISAIVNDVPSPLNSSNNSPPTPPPQSAVQANQSSHSSVAVATQTSLESVHHTRFCLANSRNHSRSRSLGPVQCSRSLDSRSRSPTPAPDHGQSSPSQSDSSGSCDSPSPSHHSDFDSIPSSQASENHLNLSGCSEIAIDDSHSQSLSTDLGLGTTSQSLGVTITDSQNDLSSQPHWPPPGQPPRDPSPTPSLTSRPSRSCKQIHTKKKKSSSFK